MTSKEYMEDVKKRFKKTRKKLDKTVEDYIVQELKEDSDNAYSFLSSLFNDDYCDKKNPLAKVNNSTENMAEKNHGITYEEFLDALTADQSNGKETSQEIERSEVHSEDDNKGTDDMYRDNIRLKKDFSGEINGVRFGYLVLELARYTRKTTQKSENFTYFEVYDKFGITAILVKSDMVKEVLFQELNLSNSDYKIVREQIKIGSYFIKPFRKKKLYRQDWIEDYQITEKNTFRNSDADAIMSCPNPKLVYTIAGYAILAYIMQVYYGFNNKVLALNIVTDSKSVDIIQNLIQNCFVNSGYNDNIGIVVFEAKSKVEIYYPNCEGRCVVIDAMAKQPKDALNSMLSKYFLYIRETTRNVEYPYLFLPIILSREPIGNEFYTIEAKDLSKNQERWEKVYGAIHRFYKNPIDIKCARIYDEETKKIIYAENILNFFNIIYDINCNSFFVPYSDSPVYKHGMDVLLNSCCSLASLNIALPAEPFSLFSAEKSRELRLSVNKYLPVGNTNDKNNDNIDLSLKSVISHIDQVIDKINGSIKDCLNDDNDDDNFEKPDKYDDNNDIGFLHKNKNFSEQCFCFNPHYIDSLLNELELEEEYSIDSFIDDCDYLGLLIRDKSEGRKKIKIRFDNGSNRLYALKVHDETDLLYTPDEIKSISNIASEAPELPIT